MTLAPTLPQLAKTPAPDGPRIWVPVFVQPLALDDLADAAREALVYVQEGERRHCLQEALEELDRLRGDLILKGRHPTSPDLQPNDSYPQRKPGWPLP